MPKILPKQSIYSIELSDKLSPYAESLFHNWLDAVSSCRESLPSQQEISKAREYFKSFSLPVMNTPNPLNVRRNLFPK